MSDIFGVGEIGGSAIDAGATIAAASIQAGAIDNATDAQRDAFNTITANNKPFLNTGTSALGKLATIYGLDAPGGTAANTNTNPSQPAFGEATGAGAGFAPMVAAFSGGTLPQATAQPGGASPVAPQGSGVNDPFASFYQSPDYQFRFGQGIRGVDAGGAARGMLDSGATRKAEIRYAGNLAAGEFGTYASRLQALAGIGQAAASNQASASQGYANNIGNLAAAGANNMGNAIGNLAGQFKSSYGGGGGGYSPGVPTGWGTGLGGQPGITPPGSMSLAGQTSGPAYGWT